MKREPNAAPQCELKKRRVEEGNRESERNTLAWDRHVHAAAQQKDRELSLQNAAARGDLMGSFIFWAGGCVMTMDRKYLKEQVEETRQNLASGWVLWETHPSETCNCDTKQTLGACARGKECARCGHCTKLACRRSGDFYICRDTARAGEATQMFCLDCDDNVGEAAALPIKREMAGKWILSGDARELCQGFAIFDAAKRLTGLRIKARDDEDGEVRTIELAGSPIVASDKYGQGENLSYVMELDYLGGRAFGYLDLEVSANPSAFKYNGGLLSAHFEIQEMLGRTTRMDVPISLRPAPDYAEATIVGERTLAQRNAAGFANAILLS